MNAQATISRTRTTRPWMAAAEEMLARSAGPSAQTAPRPAVALPFAPLEALVDAVGGLGECGLSPIASPDETHRALAQKLGRAYRRARKRGWVTVFEADRLAIQILGLHPADVWADAWWQVNQELDSAGVPA